MSDKFFVGMDITASENNGKRKPISRVTLWLDDNNCLTAGDDTGEELQADCPHATQSMVNSILAQVKGYEYQAYSAEEANIDPAAELGDGVTVDGMYSVISRIDDDGSGYAGLSAPGEDELEDEYPSAGPMTQEFNRQLAQTRSTISKTAEQIRLEVANDLEGLSAAIEIDLTEIIGRVEDAESGLSQTVRLSADGLTITNAAGSKLEIDGGQLKTNSIETDALKANSVTIDKLSITGSISWADLATDAQNQVISAQNQSMSAYNLANNANSLATSVGSMVDGWTYQGSTYIDGTMLKTGTVMASKLLGGTVGLLDTNQTVIGGIALSYTTSGLGMDMYTSYGGMRMRSAGNFYAESASGAFLTLGSSGSTPLCQLGGGALVIASYSYGTSLPSSGVQGQVFFLIGG